MYEYVIDPIPNETPRDKSWMEMYTMSIAKSYANSLDQMVYRHMNRFERFLFRHKILWLLKLFSRYSIEFDIHNRTQTLMRGKEKLETIKTF